MKSKIIWVARDKKFLDGWWVVFKNRKMKADKNGDYPDTGRYMAYAQFQEYYRMKLRQGQQKKIRVSEEKG